MTPARFERITGHYPRLRLAVLGDFCLDRYLEIDPAREEISIETGLPVHNVLNVRAQPGAAGTIVNNLVALGVGALFPIGFCGDDGEGFELRRALGSLRGVQLDHFVCSGERRTFTYCKPLVVEAGKSPVELSRLDVKNWSSTPKQIEDQMIVALCSLAENVDGIVILDQVDLAGTGVVTPKVLEAVASIVHRRPDLFILADSRRGLGGFPRVCLKMNRQELAKLTGAGKSADLVRVERGAIRLAQRHQRRVFVTLSEEGMLGASPDGDIERIAALPVRGPIDVVGAGDAVTAGLTAAFAGGANLREALYIANGAASLVVHQLGTTGTATVDEIRAVLLEPRCE
jgi:rfaE bifunctional protein kinase chain/domain